MSLPLHHQSAHVLLERLARGDCTSVQLLKHFAQRIAQHNPALNAVVVLDLERAHAQALAADAARAQGQCLGPLHGLPMTVKEAFDLPGTPSTWGFEHLRHHIPAQTATAVARLQAAGAIVYGKTNVPVALADWQTFNPVYGTTHNPWDLGRTPGGSSGGSAAALAAGLTALELGSDIGASIRNPAHYCGVYGHKPTWGVVPMAGHAPPGIPCIDTLDIAVAGPLARSARDLHLAMEVLCTPLQHFGPLGWQSAQWRPVRRTPRECRVAIVFDDAQARVDNSIQSRLHALADFLRAQGVQVFEDRRPVDSAHSHRVYMHLLRAATGAMLDEDSYHRMQQLAERSNPASDGTPERTWRGSTLSHRDWVAFDQQRAVLRAQWQAFFQDIDLLIAPTATSPAFAHNQAGERWERMIPVNGLPQPSTDGLFWAGYPGVVGLPATAIPLGLSPEGLPVGAQIIGDSFADPLCLQMAQWLEAAWCGFSPPPAFV
jgi:amidase